MNYKDYADYNDNELLSYIEENNEIAEEIMLKKYVPVIHMVAKTKYKIWKNTMGDLEINELIEAGIIGAYNGIKYFDKNKKTRFSTFIYICINHKMNEWLSKRNTKNYQFNNETVKFTYLDEIYGEGYSENFFSNNESNPEQIVEKKEEFETMYNNICKYLSNLEQKVFLLKYEGLNVKQIKNYLNIDGRTISNALCRIRNKIKKYNLI